MTAESPATPAPTSPVVEFRDVRYGYDGHAVVDQIRLRIDRGECLALVGRSGAGKSTLLKLINRLVLPDAGVVLVDGRDTREWDPIRLRRRTGYVLQSIGLFPHLTVEENVTIVPRLEGWDLERRRARARELLALVGLPSSEMASRWPHELSGGQQQRVGVARALAASPPVLLMDEPFGALDAITRRELQQLVRRIQQELHQTIVLVTHDIVEAGVLGTRIGVVDRGRLVACDTPDAVRRSDDPRVRQLLDAAVFQGSGIGDQGSGTGDRGSKAGGRESGSAGSGSGTGNSGPAIGDRGNPRGAGDPH